MQAYPLPPDDDVTTEELRQLERIDRALDAGLADWLDEHLAGIKSTRHTGGELTPDLGALEGVYEDQQYSELEFVSGHPEAAWN